jgi:hypothetical protein
MFIQMLKNQRVTFVNTANQAEAYSPYVARRNPNNGCYVVYDVEGNIVVAAGMAQEEAEACIMFKANEYILRKLK